MDFIPSLIKAFILSILNCRAYCLMCYICGQNDLPAPGECRAQFEYDCASYAARFPPNERLSCRTTRHRVGNGTYNVLKECITVREHLDMFPNGKMHGCVSLFDETGFEVSYCMCEWDLCNQQPLHMQIQKLEQVQTPQLPLSKQSIPLQPDFPMPPEMFSEDPVIPKGVTLGQSADKLIAGTGRDQGWGPFSNEHIQISSNPAHNYANIPPAGAAFVVDGRGPIELKQSFAKQPYDPQAPNTDWPRQKPTKNTNDSNLPLPWKTEKQDQVTKNFLDDSAGNLVNIVMKDKDKDIPANLNMQLPEDKTAYKMHETHSTEMRNMSTVVTSERVSLLPPLQESAGTQWQQKQFHIGRSPPSNKAMMCYECSEKGLIGPKPECATQLVKDCTQQYPTDTKVYCVTTQTRMPSGSYDVDKKCVSDEMLAQEYGQSLNLPGCESAWNGQVNLCICQSSNCNSASLADQWDSIYLSSSMLENSAEDRQIVEIQPIQPIPQLVVETNNPTILFPSTTAMPELLTSQKCYVCGESDLSTPSDCAHQYKFNCSSQYKYINDILCLTRQTKLSSGLYSMEKRCISASEHKQQYPDIDVVMEGCGQAWDNHVIYCVCAAENCNQPTLQQQRVQSGVVSPSSAPPTFTEDHRRRPPILSKQAVASLTKPPMTSLDLNPSTESQLSQVRPFTKPNQLPPDFEQLLKAKAMERQHGLQGFTATPDPSFYNSVYERHLKKNACIKEISNLLLAVIMLINIVAAI